MIKGLLAFFTSKALWNPATLFGVCLGIWAFKNHPDNQALYDFYKTQTPWIACAVAGFVLTYMFKKPYKARGRRRIDMKTYFIRSIVTGLHTAFASFMTLMFVFFMSA